MADRIPLTDEDIAYFLYIVCRDKWFENDKIIALGLKLEQENKQLKELADNRLIRLADELKSYEFNLKKNKLIVQKLREALKEVHFTDEGDVLIEKLKEILGEK